MKLYRMTNAKGELVMIAPLHTYMHLNLLTEREAQMLQQFVPRQKWCCSTATRPRINNYVEFQFEVMEGEVSDGDVR